MNEEKSKKIKKLSKAVWVISKISKMLLTLVIGVLAFGAICLPIFTFCFRSDDNNIELNEKRSEVVEEIDNEDSDNIEALQEDDVEETVEEKVARIEKETEKEIDEYENDEEDAINSFAEKSISKITGKKVGPGLTVILGELTILFIGFVTYLARQLFLKLEKLFKNFEKGETPFTKDNANLVKSISKNYLLLLVLGIFGFDDAIQIDINIGTILTAIIVFVLSIIFDYGCELQRQSDETL